MNPSMIRRTFSLSRRIGTWSSTSIAVRSLQAMDISPVHKSPFNFRSFTSSSSAPHEDYIYSPPLRFTKDYHNYCELRAQQKRVPVGLLNYILEHLIEFNKFDDALEILIESCAMNEVPYIKYFSDVINGFRMSYEYDKALATYDLMLEGGLTPKMITFCRVVECAVKSGDWNYAKELHHESTNMNREPSIVTYNILLNGCGMNRDLKFAQELVKEIKDLNLAYQPNTIGSLSLIYGKFAKPDLAIALIDRAEKVMVPHEEHWDRWATVIIGAMSACLNARKYAQVIDFYENKFVHLRGIADREIVFVEKNYLANNVLLAAKYNLKQYQEVIDFFENTPTVTKIHLRRQAGTYGRAIQSYWNLGQEEKARELFAIFEKQKVSLSLPPGVRRLLLPRKIKAHENDNSNSVC